MPIIIIIIIITFLVLIGWIWSSLGNIEKTTKIICIIIGLIITYIITFIIYKIAKNGITFENKKADNMIQTVIVIIFSIINGYLILPYTFRKLEQIDNEEIEKLQIKKSIIILAIVILVLFIFESLYFKDIIQGILSMK